MSERVAGSRGLWVEDCRSRLSRRGGGGYADSPCSSGYQPGKHFIPMLA